MGTRLPCEDGTCLSLGPAILGSVTWGRGVSLRWKQLSPWEGGSPALGS